MANYPVSPSVIQAAEELLRRKNQTQQNALAAGQLKMDTPGDYARYGNTMPYSNDASPGGRFRDMSMRQQSRLASANAAVQAVKERQAQEAAANAAKLAEHENLVKYGGKKEIAAPYGKASVTHGETDRKPRMYIGPKTANPQMLEGEALQEVFQRAANAGSPNAGVGMLPNAEPGYGGTKLADAKDVDSWKKATDSFRASEEARRSKLMDALKAVRAQQVKNVAQGSKVVADASAQSGMKPYKAGLSIGIEPPAFGVKRPQSKTVAPARMEIAPIDEATLAVGDAVDQAKEKAKRAFLAVDPVANALRLKKWLTTPR